MMLKKETGSLSWIHYFTAIWLFTALVIAILVDAEQILIPDITKYDPNIHVWPPQAIVSYIHWWGETYDPACVLREAPYRFLVWLDLIYYVPFYIFGLYGIYTRAKWFPLQLCIQQAALATGTATIWWDNMVRLEAMNAPLETVIINSAAYSSYILVPVFLISYCSFAAYFFPPERIIQVKQNNNDIVKLKNNNNNNNSNASKKNSKNQKQETKKTK